MVVVWLLLILRKIEGKCMRKKIKNKKRRKRERK